jgi:hypothetical protein
MRTMRRVTLTAILLTATVALPATTASAASAPRTATDHLGGLQFTLSGKKLTLKITKQHRSKSSIGKLLRGRRVNVTCATNAASGTPNSRLVARGSGTWTRSASTRTFTLSRNIAAKADWCMVQAGGTIGSYVDFKLGRNPREGGGA